MEGERERLPDRAVQPGRDPLAQFAGRLAAEREHQHPGRVEATVLDPVCHRLDDGGGLAGARACQHQQRAAGMPDHPLLRGVEAERGGGRGGAADEPVRGGSRRRGAFHLNGIPADGTDIPPTVLKAGRASGRDACPRGTTCRRRRRGAGSLRRGSAQRRVLMSGQQRAVGVNHTPPGDRAATGGQDPADLAGTAAAQVLGDVAVGHHVARRDRLDHVRARRWRSHRGAGCA